LPNVVVVGTQWGDEGKGKIVDLLTEQAAMVVIHEALHHAGLPERPHDKKAMTSGQINDMVREACGL